MCGSQEETGKCDVLHGRDKVGAREETKMEKPACTRTLVLPSFHPSWRQIEENWKLCYLRLTRGSQGRDEL